MRHVQNLYSWIAIIELFARWIDGRMINVFIEALK